MFHYHFYDFFIQYLSSISIFSTFGLFLVVITKKIQSFQFTSLRKNSHQIKMSTSYRRWVEGLEKFWECCNEKIEKIIHLFVI